MSRYRADSDRTVNETVKSPRLLSSWLPSTWARRGEVGTRTPPCRRADHELAQDPGGRGGWFPLSLRSLLQIGVTDFELPFKGHFLEVGMWLEPGGDLSLFLLAPCRTTGPVDRLWVSA